jgi:hypothetical protein
MTNRSVRVPSRSALLVATLALAATAPLSAQYSPGASCTIAGPGYSSCAGYVTFSSYVLSEPFRPFQAQAGSGLQPTINVYFNPPVPEIRVRVNDSDFDDNLLYYFRQNIGRTGPFVYAGDNTPGVFTSQPYSFGPTPTSTRFTRLELVSDGADYVNWHVQFRPWAGGPLCNIAQHRTGCGTTVTVTPFHLGSNFDPFQAVAGTGAQTPIEIEFDLPLYSVTVTAVDPDYGGSRIEAYGLDGALLATEYFDGDNLPGTLTTDPETITDARGIKRIKLIADPNDYVAFQALTATTAY